MAEILTHQLAIPTTRWRSLSQTAVLGQGGVPIMPAATGITELVTVVSGGRYYATATCPGGHGLEEGQAVRIAGVTPTGYNRDVVPVIVDPTHFTYLVDSDLIDATGFGTATPLVECQIALITNTSDDGIVQLYYDFDSGIYKEIPPKGTYQVDVPPRQKFALENVKWSPTVAASITINVDYV